MGWIFNVNLKFLVLCGLDIDALKLVFVDIGIICKTSQAVAGAGV